MTILDRIKQAFLPGEGPGKLSDPDRKNRLVSLTEEEREAFLILIEGYTLQFCAEKMGIRHSTANSHQHSIYKKLGVRSRASLIMEYKDFIEGTRHGEM